MARQPEFAEIDRRLLSELMDAGLAPAVIYDVGAAMGYWSALVCDHVFRGATYHLFEPLAASPQYAACLERVVAEHPNFTLHPVALGAENGVTAFWTDAEQFGSTGIEMRDVPGFTARTVPMRQLDEYVASHHLPLPDAIKLDVQGLELEILQHARACLENATALYVETWLVRGYGARTPLLHEVQEFLDKQGFDLLELGDRYYAPGHQLAAIDALFVKRSWARDPTRKLRAGDWALQG